MYLKQIELIGFKSFPERTVLVFNPGITAIVGPNGCGKSNILDAIRWVLGEQSARELRTFQMAEVIFNGSEHRSPLGMAEVTLTLDNHDGQLPIEYSEVQVTRRVYRSGEGEYFLNKSPCRLKDITELFMDTGIGTDAYSIIGQGKIDQIISTHPEDRRELFEEVAGIVKYKSRRKIAIRKLESSEQNLLRLGDIIAEIERQLRSLKRQAHLAQRYRNLVQRLKELEIRNAWFAFNSLQERIRDQSQFLTEKKEQLQQLLNTLHQLEAEEEESLWKRQEIEKHLTERRETHYQIESSLEQLESQLELISKEIEFTQYRIQSAEEERTQLLDSVDRIAHQMAEQEKERQFHIQRQEELNRLIQQYKEEEQQLLDELQKTESELAEKQKWLLEEITSKSQHQTLIQSLEIQRQNILKQQDELRQQLSHITHQYEVLNKEQSELEVQIRTVQDTVEQTEREIQQCEDKQKELNDIHQKEVKSLQQLRESMTRLEARLYSLQELREKYEGYTAGVRAIMSAKNEGILLGEHILGPIGDLIQTERGYEVAIESALGANINNIVVRTADSAKLAIAFLKERWAGRVTFLPLDTLRPGTMETFTELDSAPGVVGPAIKYVHVEEELLPAVQYLLYNTYIVQTIDDAIHIAKTSTRYPRLVTLDGEVITPSGAVTGGRTRHESRGVLTRVTEIQDLQHQLANLQEEIHQAITKISEIEQNLSEIQQQLNRSQQHKSERISEIQSLQIQSARIHAQLEQIKHQEQTVQSSLSQLETELQRLDEERKQMEEQTPHRLRDDAKLREEIDQLQAGVNLIRARIEQKRSQLSEIRIQLTQVQSHVTEIEHTIARLQHEQIQHRADAEAIAYQILELSQLLEGKQEQIKSVREQLSALSEQRAHAQREMVATQEQYQQYIQKFEETNRHIKELRQTTQAIQEQQLQMEVELSRLNQQAEFMRERILEEYQVDLSTLTYSEVGADEWDETERAQQIEQIKQQIQRMGTVNPMAIEEYEQLQQRYEFLIAQQKDLVQAKEKLQEVIRKIDETVLSLFTQTFKQVNEHFKEYFRRIFGGGHARLYLADESDPLESGIEIEARPPGKKPQSIHLLSGGEQALVAIALLFAIFKTKPTPFCFLDEVDAPLDDNNISRFLELVKEFTQTSQFIIITHNKQTMAQADAIIGITQQERGVSEIISVKLKELEETNV